MNSTGYIRLSTLQAMRGKMKQHVALWQHKQTCPQCRSGQGHNLGDPLSDLMKRIQDASGAVDIEPTSGGGKAH